MNNIACAKRNIRVVISGSKVPEDPRHSENTLEWLLKLEPGADQALQIAALAHDIDRAVEPRKVHRSDYIEYDAFKAAHACNGAKILKEILNKCAVAKSIADEACRLVRFHEVGGDPRSDLLKDADSLSYFEVNMPLYYQREGWVETKRRCIWGYRRLSAGAKEAIKSITYQDEVLTRLLNESIQAVGSIPPDVIQCSDRLKRTY
ncbi:MAG: DUF4202 family protein [candidate division Zixibacteria bacterium]|nr:DUF4202 family protein [candidate division Zixibacteria bacterium]